MGLELVVGAWRFVLWLKPRSSRKWLGSRMATTRKVLTT